MSKRYVFKRQITVRLPDMSTKVYPLPSAKGFVNGALCNIAVMFGGHIVVVWFMRVPGGWTPIVHDSVKGKP